MILDQSLFLFRHGETYWNTEFRKQGHLDSSLTQRGRQQARDYALALDRLTILDDNIAIFASPLGRAKETVSIMLMELGLTRDCVTWDRRLMECSFGAWEGLTRTEISNQFPDLWMARSKDKWNVSAPNGESYADVHARVSEWMSEATFDRTSLVVSHGLTLRVLRGIYAGLSHQQVFELGEPQNGFFELHSGKMEFFELS